MHKPHTITKLVFEDLKPVVAASAKTMGGRFKRLLAVPGEESFRVTLGYIGRDIGRDAVLVHKSSDMDAAVAAYNELG